LNQYPCSQQQYEVNTTVLIATAEDKSDELQFVTAEKKTAILQCSTIRVYLVYVINAKRRWSASNLHRKGISLSHRSAYRLLSLVSTFTISIHYYYSARKLTHILISLSHRG